MKPGPALVFVVGCAAMVAMPLALLTIVPPTGSSSTLVPPCPAIPFPHNSIPVPAGQDVVLGSVSANNSNPYGGPAVQWRLSMWSSSSVDYELFLLTPPQYSELVATHGSGFNGSVLTGPPTSYFWTSGGVTSTNSTLLMGNGTWYMLVYNPGSQGIMVNFESESCNAP